MKDSMALEGASDSVSMADHMWTRDKDLATEMRLESNRAISSRPRRPCEGAGVCPNGPGDPVEGFWFQIRLRWLKSGNG